MENVHFIAELVATIVGLLILAAAVAGLAKRLKLPYTVLLVVTGMALASLAERGPHFLRVMVEHAISPEVILFVFLPTLIFESAYNLDFRQLRHNLLPILTLAVPGLILSTALIGLIVWFCTPIELAPALLLGAILSATDPVAVISLFKQLGAPRRLTVLVEGESLFNDATSIVVARLLLGVAVAGGLTGGTVLTGILDFLVVFAGGILVGWLAAVGAGLVLGRVAADSFIEITLTTILAYLSFLAAEELFHVSGVMATVAAGITMGGWGRTKVSPSVADYLEHFWEYLAKLANALIFLLVGLRVELFALVESFDLLLWVILAMLFSRAVVIYGLVPLTAMLPGVEPVSRSFRTVMYWGGLRGAIALAIVLSLTDFPHADTFVALVMGAVLFTLIVQGLTIEKLVRWLGLDKPPLGDRLARAEGLLAARQSALDRIPDLQSGGLFSARIADELRRECEKEIAAARESLADLRHSGELVQEQERLLLFARSFAAEKNYYYDLFSKGHLSEQAYRDLCHSIDLQDEAVHAGRSLPRYTLHPPHERGFWAFCIRLLDLLPPAAPVAERWRIALVARDYEEVWGRYQGSSRILAHLDETIRAGAVNEPVLAELREHYRYWHEGARGRLDDTAAQFPEFVNAMQKQLAGRLIVHAQKEVIESETRTGIIPVDVARKILVELAGRIRRLRGSELAQLQVDPAELLRKVPFFQGIPPDEFSRITEKLKPHTLVAGRVIIRQGEAGESLYLIARGVVRISRRDNGGERDLATLIAGDFFGEMALLHRQPRTATCRAVTPCVLYELDRPGFDEVRETCPAIQAALEEADRKRRRANQP